MQIIITETSESKPSTSATETELTGQMTWQCRRTTQVRRRRRRLPMTQSGYAGGRTRLTRSNRQMR